MAPPSLVGTTMDVRGPFDPESNELLVWEIEKLQGLRFSHRGDIFFHHPVRGDSTGCVSVPSGAKELEVDTDEEPTAAKEQRLIHLPVEGVTFDAQLRTKIAYTGSVPTLMARRSTTSNARAEKANFSVWLIL